MKAPTEAEVRAMVTSLADWWGTDSVPWAREEAQALADSWLAQRDVVAAYEKALREIAEPSMKSWPQLADERRGIAAAALRPIHGFSTTTNLAGVSAGSTEEKP